MMPPWVREFGELIESGWVLLGLWFLLMGIATLAGAIEAIRSSGTSRRNGLLWLAVGGLMVGSTIYWHLNSYACTISIVNTTPYQLRVATSQWLNEDQQRTMGWGTIAPGDELVYHQVVRGRSPSFHAYAETDDPEAVAYSYRGWSEISGERVTQLSFGGSLILRVSDPQEPMDYIKQTGSDLPFEAGFEPVPQHLASGEENLYRLVLRDPGHFPDLAMPVESESDLRSLRQLARMLGESLLRQRQYAAQWKESDILPFTLGVKMSDRDDLVRGVVIEQAIGLPNDRAPRFSPGDVLLTLNGHHVYGIWDVGAILHRHATSLGSGIEVPITFEVLRAGQLQAGETTYWFVKEYFDRLDAPLTEAGAAAAGLFDGIVFGWGAETAAGLQVGSDIGRNVFEWAKSKFDDGYRPEYVEVRDYSALEWQQTQKKAMRKQWFEESYRIGEFGSLVVNLPRAATKLAAPRAVRGFSKSMPGAIVFEVAETVAWEYKNTDPLRTRSELAEDIRAVIPWAIGGGAIQGVLGSGRSKR